eukprot:3300096-Amphidinium_carterae.1
MMKEQKVKLGPWGYRKAGGNQKGTGKGGGRKSAVSGGSVLRQQDLQIWFQICFACKQAKAVSLGAVEARSFCGTVPKNELQMQR